MSIPTSGKYDVTITFNGSTVSATATKKEDVVVIPSIAMHGNFTGSWTDTENFTLAEDNNTATLKLTMAAGNYEFGMRIGGSGNWTANGKEFTRENPVNEIVAGDGNLKLAADKAGDYKFVWTFESNELAITFPSATAIDNTEISEKAVKMFENGQLIIIKNGVRYDATGAVVR